MSPCAKWCQMEAYEFPCKQMQQGIVHNFQEFMLKKVLFKISKNKSLQNLPALISYEHLLHVYFNFYHTHRAWQKKLHTLVSSDEHKAEMYKYLHILMTTLDPTTLQDDLKAFMTLWQKKEPLFVTYFNQNYANRVGKYLATM